MVVEPGLPDGHGAAGNRQEHPATRDRVAASYQSAASCGCTPAVAESAGVLGQRQRVPSCVGADEPITHDMADSPRRPGRGDHGVAIPVERPIPEVAMGVDEHRPAARASPVQRAEAVDAAGAMPGPRRGERRLGRGEVRCRADVLAPPLLEVPDRPRRSSWNVPVTIPKPMTQANGRITSPANSQSAIVAANAVPCVMTDRGKVSLIARLSVEYSILQRFLAQVLAYAVEDDDRVSLSEYPITVRIAATTVRDSLRD